MPEIENKILPPKDVTWFLWISLGLSLIFPVWLLSILIGDLNRDLLSVTCCIGLCWVIFDVGKLIFTKPPSVVLTKK